MEMKMKNEQYYRDEFKKLSALSLYKSEIFAKVIQSVLKHEGGYVNDPQDAGGETNFGISKRQYPHIDIKGLDIETAKCIYFVDYWVANKVYELGRNTELLTKFLDMSILSGNTKAVKLLQRSARVFGVKLAEDGIFGKQTLDFVRNHFNSFMLTDILKSEWANELRSLNNPRFIEGWLNRAYA